jgi:hypothetical protein
VRPLALGLGSLSLAFVVAQRLFWLAPTRAGWVFYLANVLGELGPKRLGLKRGAADAVLAVAGLALLGLGGAPPAALATALVVLLGLGIAVAREERRLLTSAWTLRDRLGPAPADPGALRGLARGYPSPSTHPQLTVNLLGPFVSRKPRLDLGTLVVGRRLVIEVVIGNHALTPTQTSVRLRLGVPPSLRVEGEAVRLLPALGPGQVHRVPVTLGVVSSSGETRLEVSVEWGGETWSSPVHVAGVVLEPPRIVSAAIRRYPGACRSAFAWRGDMDLYDTSTLQSVEGLENALGLAARYRFPQTLYLSTRLSLDQRAAAEWAAHYGIDRGAGQIPRLVEWMRSKVQLVHRSGYPFDSEKPCLAEIGNHGHLHFGTDTAAAPENGWRPRSRIGAGAYAWQGDERGSLAEQRDNALEARRWCETALGFSPRSWAMPDRTRDEHTPAAMEAAGCEVLSDSDVRTRDNVLFQPPPHFAPGSSAVELTKRYPGDPEHLLHYWMNLFWVHRAHRLGIPVVFMCHQHMRLFDGWACTRLTEGVLRHVLHAFSGDLRVDTVYGIGVYWRDVLSERARVGIRVEDGRVLVRSAAPLAYGQVPVDVTFEGGGRATVLVDLAPGSEVAIDARGAR